MLLLPKARLKSRIEAIKWWGARNAAEIHLCGRYRPASCRPGCGPIQWGCVFVQIGHTDRAAERAPSLQSKLSGKRASIETTKPQCVSYPTKKRPRTRGVTFVLQRTSNSSHTNGRPSRPPRRACWSDIYSNSAVVLSVGESSGRRRFDRAGHRARRPDRSQTPMPRSSMPIILKSILLMAFASSSPGNSRVQYRRV